MLLWHGQVPSCYLFANVQEISFSSKSQHKSKPWKRINRGVGYGLENAGEYVFYGNEKAIQWAKKTLEGADGNVKKKC